MKKSFFGLSILFILLTTYTPRFNFFLNSSLQIQTIQIKNNSIIKADDIKKKLSFLYEKNLFFLNTEDISKILKNDSFIKSFSIKKIFPNTIKLIIVEKKPIAILQNKKKKFYISENGNLIKFIGLDLYVDLPTVFGNEKDFYVLYKNLQNIKFPIKTIKTFYLFESKRWDLIMNDDKLVKLPIKNYLFALKNFVFLKENSNFDNYNMFDYRIKDQLILN